MSELTIDRLFEYVFDDVALTADEQSLLARDHALRGELAQIRGLASELAIARASLPRTEIIERYTDLFQHVTHSVKETEPPVHESIDLVGRVRRGMSNLLSSLQAQLTLDSRQGLALAGVRSTAASSYRLLYTTPEADIELLVDTSGNGRRLTGELLPLQENAISILPALLHLSSIDDSDNASSDSLNDTLVTQTTTDANGRFRLTGIKPGNYSLVLTPPEGDLIEIEPLEIT
ncbi:hypothetical protein KFU94_55440 [Chloroflexi bacterium TSY]|nr:hypothetical protein [Chloroflexi bacterium TSY]